jgi:superfamily II DNA/RNA helicase
VRSGPLRDPGLPPDVECLVTMTPQAHRTMLSVATVPTAIVSLDRATAPPEDLRAESPDDAAIVAATRTAAAGVADAPCGVRPRLRNGE